MAKRQHSPKLSATLEVELRDKLEDLLDQEDDVADKRRRMSKLLGGHLKVVKETVARTRRQLKGMDLDQLEIPGTTMPEPATDPLLQEVLRIAGIIPVVTPEEGEDAEAEECQACGVMSNDPSPECDECDHSRAQKKEPGPLLFVTRADNGRVREAVVEDGAYRLTFDPSAACWSSDWLPKSGKGKSITYQRPEAEGRAACLAHHLERLADEKLRDAGSGDLTKADTKGDAVARKKGGRRG